MIPAQEIKRQLVHVIYGLLLIILVRHHLIDSGILFIAGILGLILAGCHKRRKIPFLKGILEILGREKENRTFPMQGLIFFTFGSALSLAFYGRDIALASIMILALGDSFSRLVGPYGKRKLCYNRDKNLEGILAGAFAAILGSQFFVPWTDATLGAVSAMAAEGVKLDTKRMVIDDNLYIPPLAGLIIWLKRLIVQ